MFESQATTYVHVTFHRIVITHVHTSVIVFHRANMILIKLFVTFLNELFVQG